MSGLPGVGKSNIASELGPNYMEVGRDVWRRAVRSQDAVIRVVHVECSDLGAHEQRLRQRNRGLSHYPEPTWAEVEQRRLEVEPWSGDVLVVDSAEPLDATVAHCLTFLRA
jgi:gluconate kinase